MPHVQGRGDHDGELAEAEHHERAVAPRQVTQGVVWWRASEVVQVADDWQRSWPRREPQLLSGMLCTGQREGAEWYG
jgi:hypothetical protein